jgi:hypothetical protein
MNTKQWTPVLSVILLAIGSAQAVAGSGWYYDEGSDTVITAYSGSAVSRPASRPDDASVMHAGTWYYDEGTDSIVFNVEGGRNQFSRTYSSFDVAVLNPELAFLDQ